MAYHKACYESSTGRTTTRVGISKPLTPGQKPYICQVCKNAIEVGQEFTWIPNGKGPGSKESTDKPPAIVIHESDLTKQERGNMPKVSGLVLTGNPITDALLSSIMPSIADVMKDLIQEYVPKEPSPTVTTIRYEVTAPNRETRDMGIQHRQFGELLTILSTGLNVLIAGPAGSGKSTAASECAKALGKDYYYTGAVAYPEKLMGFMSATGSYVSTAFFEAYTKGGLFCWDELDASDANAILAFNAALENGTCDFPHGNFPRHHDFQAVATANTWGHGATTDYCGRNKLDQAFLDRFVNVSWGYDEDLELALGTVPEFTRYVQAVRKKVYEKGIRVLVTPRASIQGGKLLKAGLPLATVLQTSVQKGMTKEQWEQVRGDVPKVQVKTTHAPAPKQEVPQESLDSAE